MKHVSSLTVAELEKLIAVERQKYAEAIQADLPFHDVKSIYIKLKELKTVLDEKSQKNKMV
jgi:hypothetical protein